MNQRKYLLPMLIFVIVTAITPAYAFGLPLYQEETSPTNPLNIQVRADERQAVHAVIPVTGGKLSVEATDGTRYTLVFPEGALLKEEDITLIPLGSIAGMPFSGRLVGGLQMAPEGLRLLHPAILTIASPKTEAAKGFVTIAFAYHQDGEGVYLNPSETNDNIITLEIWHFSGGAAVQATPAEIQEQQQRIPSNPEDAFTQRMQEYLGRERQAELLGLETDPAFEKMMGDFLREAYTSFIAPQLSTALHSCDAAPAILSRAMGWERQVQLLGFGATFQAEQEKIMQTMEQVIVNCYNIEYDQCVIDNDMKHRIKMLGILRQAALLGIEDRLDQSKILKCPKMRYNATGQQMEITYSGIICNLAESFTVKATSAYYAFTIQFTPSGPQAGSFTYTGAWFNVGPMNGDGTYTVKAIDNAASQLNLETAHTTSTGVGDVKGNIRYNIDLVPLGPGECSGK